MNFFLVEGSRKTGVFIQIYFLKNSSRGQLRSCENIIYIKSSDT